MRFINHHSTFQRCSCVNHVHPGRLRWNLQITHLERKIIFQTVWNHVFITRPTFACFFTSKEWSAVAMCDAAKRCEKRPFWNGGCCGWNQANPGKLNKNQPGLRMVGWYLCVFVLCFFSAPKNMSVYSLLLFVCITLDWRFKTKKRFLRRRCNHALEFLERRC